MNYLIPPNEPGEPSAILPTDPICRDTQRTKGQTTADSPMLRATSGDSVVLQYQENGHVTGNQSTKPDKLTSGAVSVYGTKVSEPTDALLSIHHVWNANGTVGDKRGLLLGRSNFDDGSCYQVENTPLSKYRQAVLHRPLTSVEGVNLWCRSIVDLPKDLENNSIYTLYWVWDWPSIGQNGTMMKPEIYTTCIDVQIIAE